MTPVNVSVVMPTFRNSWHLNRSYLSLVQQSVEDWELIVVDDASPDDTAAVVRGWNDRRVRYIRNPHNLGLAASLNIGQSMTLASTTAYLPSDDRYHRTHLETLLTTLNDRPDIQLVYGGLQTNHLTRGWRALTLTGNEPVDAQLGSLNPTFDDRRPPISSGNILALVQVAHRLPADVVRWPERREVETDRLEANMWIRLHHLGFRFASTNQISCDYSWHPNQRHKIISDVAGSQMGRPRSQAPRGLSGFRAFYRVPDGQPLNWQPSRGPQINEGDRYPRQPSLPRNTSLTERPRRILIVGELGFNPDRLHILHQRGHSLAAIWTEYPEEWDTAHSLPDSNIRTIPSNVTDAELTRHIDSFRPDVAYGLLNYHAIPMILRVMRAVPHIPLIFHFKESPFLAMREGLWNSLVEIVGRAAAMIFISDENRLWFEQNISEWSNARPYLVFDGDLPSATWMKPLTRSAAADDEIHTVCVGRPLGLDYVATLTKSKIHFHLFGDYYKGYVRDLNLESLVGKYLHVHPTVEPRDWVAVLSGFDAAWTHVWAPDELALQSESPSWGELNLPARLATYALAGLPWIVQKHPSRPTAVEALASQGGFGLPFSNVSNLSETLGDRPAIESAKQQMVKHRHQFTFDQYVERFERLIDEVSQAQ